MTTDFAVILRSRDDQDYALVFLPPQGATYEDSLRLASLAIERATTREPEEYTSDDVRREAEALGCSMPLVIHGPQWD